MPARRKKAKRKPRQIQGRPADEAEAPEVLPPEAAQNLPVPARPPIGQPGDPAIPRNAEDVIANAINRQLVDELEHPAPEDPLDAEIISLKEVFNAIDDGRSIAELTPIIAKATGGQDQLDNLVYTHYRRYRAKKLVRWMENDAKIDRFLNRVFARGDFTPAEALVFKRLSQSEIKDQAMQILNEMRDGVSVVAPDEAANRIDYNVQQMDTTITEKTFAKMTPQGREIVRKLVYRARTRMFKKRKGK